MSSGSEPSVYYKFVDDSGRVHLVDSLATVPARYRERAERIELASRPASEQLSSATTGNVHWPSFAAGFGSGLALALLLFVLFRTSFQRTAKLVLAAALIALLGALYFGALKRQVDPAAPLLGQPQDVLEAARKNVSDFEQRQKEQERELEQLR